VDLFCQSTIFLVEGRGSGHAGIFPGFFRAEKIFATASPCEGPYPPSRMSPRPASVSPVSIEVRVKKSSGWIFMPPSGSSLKMSCPAGIRIMSGQNRVTAGTKTSAKTAW
jgi:hypothetical protein